MKRFAWKKRIVIISPLLAFFPFGEITFYQLAQEKEIVA